MTSTALRINKLTPAIGAEITGIDFSSPLDQAHCDALYRALLDHQVIFLRGQKMAPDAHLAFARSFGDPEPPHPVYPHVEGFEQVVLLATGPDNPPDTDGWHTDVTFHADPPFATILYAREIPPVGGDTLWLSTTAAYEALPPGMKADLADLMAVHDMGSFRNDFAVGEAPGDASKVTDAHQRFGSAIHPVVRLHPATGKPHLFVNRDFTRHVVGMSTPNSDRLLAYLFDHIARPEFQVRFKWTVDTIAMWDNRCTQHYATADYLPHTRRMHRVTVTNDRRADATPQEGSRAAE